MRTCTKCNQSKELAEFSLNKLGKYGRASQCKQCIALKRRTHLHSCSKARERNKLSVKKHRDNLRAWISSIKTEIGCFYCDEDHPAILDFHHEDSNDKDRDICMYSSKQKAIQEINKCIVLCANCHRKLHYRLKNGSINKSHR